MTRKMKRTLTRAQQAKLRKENMERAKRMKEAKEKCGKRGVEKKVREEKGRCYRQDEEGDTCPERDMKVLKWHRTLNLMATFSEGCERDHSKYQRDLQFQTTSKMAIQEAEEAFLVGLLK